MFLNLIQCHFAVGNHAFPTPSRNIGTINPKGLHQADGIPGHLGSMALTGAGPTAAPPPARAPAPVSGDGSSRGHPGPPPGSCQAGRTSARASSVKVEIDKRNFAASRLRVNPCSRPDRPPATGHDRLPGKPVQAIAQPRPGSRAAATSYSRKPGNAAMVERQPGAAAHRPARIAKQENSLEYF